MRAAILNLDDALQGQPGLQARLALGGGEVVDARDLGPDLRLWSRPISIERLQSRIAQALPAAAGERIVFAGSGDFHHLTPTLIARALSVQAAPATVIHFDNHPDWVRFKNGLHCGSWVGAAARMANVAKVITIGVCSADVGRRKRREGDLSLVADGRLSLHAYRDPDGGEALTIGELSNPTIETLGLPAYLSRLLAEIETSAIYVTIDKDVLHPGDAATNWDQGAMRIEELVIILRALLGRHAVIGADVFGDWSRAAYGANPVTALRKRGEAWLDQPRQAPAGANARNEAVNLQLLDLFAEARA